MRSSRNERKSCAQLAPRCEQPGRTVERQRERPHRAGARAFLAVAVAEMDLEPTPEREADFARIDHDRMGKMPGRGEQGGVRHVLAQALRDHAERDALAADPRRGLDLALLEARAARRAERPDRGRQLGRRRAVRAGRLAWLGSKGFGSGTLGFSIDVSDTGLDTGSTSPGHPDFRVDGQSGGASRVAYGREYSQDSSANDCTGHGTNVASIAAGFGAGTGGTRRTARDISTAWASPRG